MDTNDEGISVDQPRPATPPGNGPPVLPPPSPGQYMPPSAPQTFAPQGFTPLYGEPTATVVPSGSTGKRSKGKVVGGLIAVVALLGAGGFAVSQIVAGDDGGAANPSEVGISLMDALAAEDALGVVDLLLPGERDMMRQPLIDYVDNLKRFEIVDATASLDKVGGLDIAFEGVEVDPTETNVDDVSNIRITATATASVDGATVPIGDLLIDEAFGGDRPDLDSEPQSSDIDWQLATVKQDGRWYLSAFYSIAESIRAGGDDIPDTSLVARGADTPDGAVQAIFDAVDDLDLEALIAALNPNEAAALQRYAPMFVDDAQAELDDLGMKIAFSDTEFSVTGSGDRRTVAIDAFSMEADDGSGDVVTVENKDGCIIFTAPDSTTTDTCELSGSIDSALSVLGFSDNGELKGLMTTVEEAFADMKPVGITVQQVDGKWFVSPIGTYFDLLLAVMGALDKNELTNIIEGVRAVADSVFEGGIFESGDIGDIGGIGDVGGIDDVDDVGGGDLSGFEACFDEVDYAGYAACLAAGIDDGSIDPAYVSPYYRFPDCGVGEVYWSGDVYSMSDEEFTAFTTAAAPCFQQYIADGTLSWFELPYELSRPDCLEGRNWYNVSDQDYTDRVLECTSDQPG